MKTNSGGIRLDTANTLQIIYSGNLGATFGTSGLNLTPGDYYSINAASVLNATTLGTLVVNSSLTSVGALGGGSISSGFGHIDNGTSNITSGGIWKVNIDSAVTPDPTTTGINTAGSITLGVGNDAGLYVQGDDLYVENKTSNKDIIFRINAGSTYTTAMTINGDAANVIVAGDPLTLASGLVTLTADANVNITASPLTLNSALVTASGAGNISISGMPLTLKASSVTITGSANIDATANQLTITSNDVGVITWNPIIPGATNVWIPIEPY